MSVETKTISKYLEDVKETILGELDDYSFFEGTNIKFDEYNTKHNDDGFEYFDLNLFKNDKFSELFYVK